MATIEEAFVRAQMILIGKKNVIGLSRTKDRIIVYATSPEDIPKTILGFPVEIIITKPFWVL
ncbi:MAG: hypothetical protein QXK24_07900 [Ignisphaera sp.]